MPRKSLICLITLFLISTAYSESVQDALKHGYEKRILALRSPFTSRDLKFDSAGQPLNARPSELWLTYGGIYVEKVKLSADTLRLEGPRTARGDKKRKPVLIRMSKPVHIDVHLDSRLNSLQEANDLLNRVFFLDGDADKHAQPEIRRADDNIPDADIYGVMDGTLGAKYGALVPRPKFTPEPEFPEKARAARYQGTVVLQIVIDKAGSVSRVKLVRPLEMGLDENAMEVLKRWHFDPATRNGVPVAFRMHIEVAFNLY